MKITRQSIKALNKAVAVLKEGGVVICPTDTVYGFLAGASNKKAVEKIYKIKKRPKSKPLPIFVKDIKMAKELAQIDDRQAKILRKLWPGKYTFILKRKITDVRRPELITDVGRPELYGVAKDTVALRIPKHAFLQKLLKKINRPLVQTSVNISNQKPLSDIDSTVAVFDKNKAIGLVINGGSVKRAQPSTIIDLTSKHLTRLR